MMDNVQKATNYMMKDVSVTSYLGQEGRKELAYQPFGKEKRCWKWFY
jgi:hypothetical protein